MKIALIGYGKMGHMIEQIALERNHEIVSHIDIGLPDTMDDEAFRSADVVIEFTTPKAAYNNYLECFKRGKAVVSGTTGWLDKLPEIKAMCEGGKQTFFYSSNFSLGVNIFFEINRKLAELMNKFDAYDPSMTETHHIHKLDAPSGTAITLADDIVSRIDRVNGWTLTPNLEKGKMPVSAIRRHEVAGIHTISYDSEADYIEIKHHARSRKGFALGVVLAAEYTAGKKGFLGMKDMLGF